jgi:hypothetical protein
MSHIVACCVVCDDLELLKRLFLYNDAVGIADKGLHVGSADHLLIGAMMLQLYEKGETLDYYSFSNMYR